MTREASSPRIDRHGPLRLHLLSLTALTGIVDAVSYLTLGHVFVANMTGNVVFLGFAVADPGGISAPASAAAVAAFLAGALGGGRLGAGMGRHRARFLAVAICVEVVLTAAALAVSIVTWNSGEMAGHYLLIVFLALTMGVQNATARRLSVPDLTTTVLTLTLTGLAADSTLAGGSGSQLRRRLAGAGMMFGGAAAGAMLIARFGVAAALAAGVALLVAAGVSISRHWHSAEEWTAGA